MSGRDRGRPVLWRLLAIALAVGSVTSTLSAQAAAPAFATAQPAGDYARAITRARAFVLDTMRALGAPGASITVMKDGQIIWSEGFGLADVEDGVAATPLSRFRVGSVSKSLTSAALGILVEEGKIDAVYQDGILTIRLPKVEAAVAKKILIK